MSKLFQLFWAWADWPLCILAAIILVFNYGWLWALAWPFFQSYGIQIILVLIIAEAIHFLINLISRIIPYVK